MNVQIRNQLKAHLLHRRKRVLEQTESAVADERMLDAVRRIEMAEEAQEESAVMCLSALERHLRRELQEIERALIKMENSTFGICERCLHPIGLTRLKAMASARYCLPCEEEFEDNYLMSPQFF